MSHFGRLFRVSLFIVDHLVQILHAYILPTTCAMYANDSFLMLTGHHTYVRVGLIGEYVVI